MQIRSRDGVASRNVDNTFEVLKHNGLVGLVKLTINNKNEACITVYRGNSNDELVVRSLSPADFAVSLDSLNCWLFLQNRFRILKIFRDQSSTTPICNIQTPYSYTVTHRGCSGKIVFNQETGITTEEQLLCSAAAIAFVSS